MILSKRLSLIICTVFLALLPAKLDAQRLISRKYTIDNGLSSNRVYSIIQDSTGFMWFGTNDGLNRFDGIEFRKYYYSEKEGSISSNSIRKIIIDRNNRMWIALDNGADIYDPRTDTFTRFSAETDQGERINTRVLDILEDRQGLMWICTNGSGLYCYSPQEDKLYSYRHDPGNANSIPQNTVTILHEDSKGNVWMGTYSEGLCCYSKSDNKFTRYKKSDGPQSISDNSIQKIFEDSYGNLWIGTFQNGLDLFDYHTGTFTNFRDRNKDNLLYHIQDIIEYAPGELMIASDNGISIFDISEGRVLTEKESKLPVTDKFNKFIYSIYRDKEESLWLGSYFDGLEFYSPLQNNFEYYSCNPSDYSRSGKVINTLREAADGKYWIGTDDNGIFSFDPRTKQVVPFRNTADINSTYYCIHDLLVDNGKLYAATYERGLEVFDLKAGTTKTYMYDPADTTSISSSRVFVLHKASNGGIYVGTSVGLCLFDRDKGTFQRLAFIGKIASIIEDSQGKIWVATSDKGLFSYDQKKKQMHSYHFDENNPESISRNTLTTLALDRKKRLWIGTHGYGLCRYNPATDNFIRYYLPEFPNHIISSIVPDGDFLWISTNKGLVHYNPDTEELKTYSTANGLYNEQFSPGAGIRSSDGKILMGAADGFCVFFPQNLIENTYNPPVVLTKMMIAGKEVQVNDPDSPLHTSLEHTAKLVLNHKQSIIGFEFASLSFIAPEENRYQYLLEGFDKEPWLTKGGNNKVSYTHLPAGEYKLRIRGTNSDKLWSSSEMCLLIRILPPFYKSGWAYFIYITSLMLAVILLALYFIRRSERSHEQRMEKLKTEKEKELYDSKIEFFTNIAHEIRTPLSLIVGPLEYLMKSRSIDNVYGDYLGIIEQNYKRLYTLVNQLLDFRKVDSGIYSLHYTVCNLKELIEKTTAIFGLTIRQKNIIIDTSGIPAEMKIVTDEEALTKVISNLLSNSLKFTRSVISITATEDENRVCIRVTDDGVGIADKDKNRIFDAFYQVRGNAEIAKLGIGIGLHMTRSLVLLMDGEISAVDREDGEKGASICLCLPKKDIETVEEKKKVIENVLILDDNENPNEAAGEKNLKQEAGKQYSIMIVDDNPEILNFLSKILASEYFVISAQSGEEAIKLLGNNQVDIIISDVMMNNINGYELCQHIKTDLNTSHIPVVLLTAKTDTESKIEGLRSGADAYIEKPFSPFHLKAQLQNLLKKRDELREKYASTPFSEIHSTVHNKLDQEFMDKCTEIIMSNISEPDFSINTLAGALGMSRTSVFVKVKGITGLTPNDFIKLTRLKTACKMMVESDYRITEIGFLVGFSSSSYFAKCFQKQFGVLPTEFMKTLKGKTP